MLHSQLEAAVKDRNSDVGGDNVPIVHMLPDTIADVPPDLPESFKDLAQHCRKRLPHERAPNTCLPRSWDSMGNFDAFAHNDVISPRSLPMVAGTKAATKCYSEDGVAKAKDPKELFVIDRLRHAYLYDHVSQAGLKMVEFFGKYLAKPDNSKRKHFWNFRSIPQLALRMVLRFDGSQRTKNKPAP